MPEPGRNDPCPCGSGAKYKKCCGARRDAEETALRTARAVRTAGATLVRDWMDTKYGPRLDHEAWDVFCDSGRTFDEEDPVVDRVFLPWAAAHWAADGREPIRQWAEEADEPRREPRLVEWADSVLASPFTFIQVTGVAPDRGVKVTDLMCSRTLLLEDRILPQAAEVGFVYLCKPTVFGGFAFPEAFAPAPIDSRRRDVLVDGLFRILGREPGRPFTPAELLPHHLRLIEAYFTCTDR